MEIETQRDREQPWATDSETMQARKEFVLGLRYMATKFDAMIISFTEVVGQIAGDPDVPQRIIGLAQFAVLCAQMGQEMALESIDRNAGIPVNIVSQDSYTTFSQSLNRNVRLGHTRTDPGIIVGLTGVVRTEKQDYFTGVALMQGERRREAFVNVRITPDGKTSLAQ